MKERQYQIRALRRLLKRSDNVLVAQQQRVTARTVKKMWGELVAIPGVELTRNYPEDEETIVAAAIVADAIRDQCNRAESEALKEWRDGWDS